MRHSFLSLYVLLTTPIPVPWAQLTKSVTLILAFAAILPFAVPLATVSLSPLKLALLATIVVSGHRNLAPTLRQFNRDELTPTVIGTLVLMVLTVSSVIVLAPSDGWLQHAISLGWVLYGGLFALILWLDRPLLGKFNWLAQHWPVGQENAARWMILRYFGMATANEFAIAHFSTTEWLVCVAALPIVFYALYYWSVLATHPYEDDV